MESIKPLRRQTSEPTEAPPEPVHRLRRALIDARARAEYTECLRRVREIVIAARRAGVGYLDLARWLAESETERRVWARRLKDRYREFLRGRRECPA